MNLQRNEPRDWEMFMDLSEVIQNKLNDVDRLRIIAAQREVPVESFHSYQQLKQDLSKLGYML